MGLEQSQHRFHISQKLTPMANRYVVHAAGPDGAEGEIVAFAHQKRLALKERITFYTDESQKQVLFTFQARQVVDLGATYDIRAASGAPVGSLRKNFAASLLRSTWHMSEEGAAAETTGVERNMAVAVLRRAWGIIPFVDVLPFAWPYHFDFARSDSPVMSVQKRLGLRDRYVLTIHDEHLDRRLAIAQAVALDALQSR
ncbi:hypothetical protein [Streptomyces sp. NPDC054975]